MDTVEQIKQKLSIVDVVSTYVQLKKAGRNYRSTCPFHVEKSPSFMVSPELQMYKCFGCGASGDMFNFVQNIEGIEFSDALKILAEKAGVEVVQTYVDPAKKKKDTIYKINQEAAKFYHYLLLSHKTGKEALEYSRTKRGLKDTTIKNFMVGVAPDSWDLLFKYLKKKGFEDEDLDLSGVVVKKEGKTTYIDKFRNRLIFPLINVDGRIVGFTGRTLDPNRGPKYLNTQETPVFFKNSFVYGLDKAKLDIKQKGAVFVEGQMDVLSAHQAGITNVVASSGTSLTEQQLQLLSRYSKELTFCFDSDDAGVMGIKRALSIAEKLDFNTRVALIPDEFSDLDELIRKDVSVAQKILEESVPIYDFFVIKAFKANDKGTSLGKKNIVREVMPELRKISDNVVLDHYITRLAKDLEISIDVLRDMLSKPLVIENHDYPDDLAQKYKNTETAGFESSRRMSSEEYMLALLLKSDLDTAQSILYKLGQRDFTDPKLNEIFINLKNYLLGRKRKFDIKYFSKRFSDDLTQIVEDLYLWDLSHVTDIPVAFSREIDTCFDRLKKDTVKRDLKELSTKIKEAERSNDKTILAELSAKFSALSEKLI